MVEKVNKKIGNDYERKFLEYLQGNGYWCHLFSYNKNGQPCDVIACKNDTSHLVDVKHCDEDRFDFKNVQSNQLTCFEYALECGNKNTGFAVWFENQGKWFYLPYLYLKQLMEEGKKSIRYENLKEIRNGIDN